MIISVREDARPGVAINGAGPPAMTDARAYCRQNRIPAKQSKATLLALNAKVVAETFKAARGCPSK